MSESAELEPWQQRIVDGFKAGSLNVIHSGRNVGKSQLAAYKRLFDDIYGRPVEDLILTEGTVYGRRYYCVEPVGGNWRKMEEWCTETFGATGDNMWGEKSAPAPGERWYMNNRKFWFRNEKDRNWFTLRWRS